MFKLGLVFNKNLSILNKCKNAISLEKMIKRNLNLLECDSKNILRKYGVNVQNFITVNEGDRIEEALQKMNFIADEYVVKAQITAGGRGLGTFDNGFKSGVHIVNNIEDVKTTVENMLGHRLITKQTTQSGALVKKVMVANGMKIRRETYFCILLDSSYDGPIIIASPEGGTDIEDLYKKNSDIIKIFLIDENKGITDGLSYSLTSHLGFDVKLHGIASQQIRSIWKAFKQIDAVQIEVNPFIETEYGEIVALDTKIRFDDNALYRQKDLNLQNYQELDAREIKAYEHNLNYVGLNGNIGCLVNGAGLAMATMDLIKLYGGEPANFLDVGGSVNENQAYEAIKLLVSDKNVKSILINIFGGIVDCTIIANGIIRAKKEIDINIPFTIRFEGNNDTKAKKLLNEFDNSITFADDLNDAAQLAVESM